MSPQRPRSADPDSFAGLTWVEVEQRIASGQINDAPDANSRSLSSIIKENTLTWFNFLIGSMWVVMLIVAPWQDSLFGFVIVANTLIGTIQEYRAARALEKLAIIGEAKPVVRRDGSEQVLSPREIVLGDLIVLGTGSQLVVDGKIEKSQGLEIDESLLTGEADPVDKQVGDSVMSGSFVVAGAGYMRATKIGRDSFAAGLTEVATQFQTTKSELRDSINKFIKYVSYFLLPVGITLFLSQFIEAQLPLPEAIRGTIAGIVTMVPEGLVLLTSISMAVSVIELARRRVLVQDLPAVEVLARVDTVCVDKTGTLTAPGMQVNNVIPLGVSDLSDLAEIEAALGAVAASQPDANPTLAAIQARYPDPDWQVSYSVPFSSSRKWSSATFSHQVSWVLGAPEMVAPNNSQMLERASSSAASGARVLVLAKLVEGSARMSSEEKLGEVECAALVVISQTLRENAAETVAYFLSQGVNVKVISGDNPQTVGAIARQAGVPGADHPFDARYLPESTEEVAEVLATTHVFGRVTPGQKQEIIDALHACGKTVAMTGDGVNDVLALKKADLGIAMGSGSDATRAVAQLVLLDDQWEMMPDVVAQGRKVLVNIERVANVFLTKSFYAMIVSSATVIFVVAFPFLPRHLTLVSALTIGIPGFFLALMPNVERFRPGFFRRVLSFAIPAGVIAAVASFTSYGATLYFDEPLFNAQSGATITLFIVTLAVLAESARPLNMIRLTLVGLMGAAFIAVLFIPWLSNIFALSLGPERYSLISIGVGLAGAVAVVITTRVTDRWRRAPKGPVEMSAP